MNRVAHRAGVPADFLIVPIDRVFFPESVRVNPGIRLLQPRRHRFMRPRVELANAVVAEAQIALPAVAFRIDEESLRLKLCELDRGLDVDLPETVVEEADPIRVCAV